MGLIPQRKVIIFNLRLLPLFMIEYKKHILDNGLTVITHEDDTTPLAYFNLIYDVGSRDESEDKTGFAHLFEHLMFGGSGNIENFDNPLQQVGGDNNAFTSPDVTNYYMTLPAENLETAFWLESDRMLSLSFDPKVLEVQKKVVIEEFKQRYLNQPYGDVWFHLRKLAFNRHPYMWPTIGKDISHIEGATMEDVKNFFYRHYAPNNAVLVVAGNIKDADVLKLAMKWFGPIPKRDVPLRKLPKEKPQTHARQKTVTADVPVNAIYKTFHMPGRTEHSYYQVDLLSDILGRGKSSRLYERLVKQNQVFNSINAYVSGSFDPGLLVVNGKFGDYVTHAEADNYISEVLEELREEIVEDSELEKVKNQAESYHIASQLDILNRAMNLAFATLLGDTDLVNIEIDLMRAVDKDQILQQARKVLTPENSSTLYYLKKGK
jgi:zinc protease